MRLTFSMIRPDGTPSREHTVESETLQIGRDPDSDILLDAQNVSSHHARICVEKDRVIIHDLLSTNGTFIDGQKIDGPGIVSPGCTLQFGLTGPRMRVVRVDAAQTATHSSPMFEAVGSHRYLRGTGIPAAPPRAPVGRNSTALSIGSVILLLAGAGIVLLLRNSGSEPPDRDHLVNPAVVDIAGANPAPTAANLPTATAVFTESNSEPVQLAQPVMPSEFRFAWIGIKNESDIILVSGGIRLDDRHVLTCGYLAELTQLNSESDGIRNAGIVVGLPDPENAGETLIVEVSDDVRTVPDGNNRELAVLALKKPVSVPSPERFSPARSDTWEAVFGGPDISSKTLTCWGISVPPGNQILSSALKPGFRKSAVHAEKLLGSGFEVPGKQILSPVRVKYTQDASDGMIVVSGDNRIMGFLSESRLIPVDRLVFGFPSEAGGLLK